MNIFLNAKKAKLEIETLLKQNPSFNLWSSINAQLVYVLNDFDVSGNFKGCAEKERVSQIVMGVQAVREIESQNAPLADLLFEIDYEYKKLYP